MTMKILYSKAEAGEILGVHSTTVSGYMRLLKMQPQYIRSSHRKRATLSLKQIEEMKRYQDEIRAKPCGRKKGIPNTRRSEI